MTLVMLAGGILAACAVGALIYYVLTMLAEL